MDMPIERGAVRLGPGEVGELDKPGLWIRGTCVKSTSTNGLPSPAAQTKDRA